jgi:aldose sugar dehydrogenase
MYVFETYIFCLASLSILIVSIPMNLLGQPGTPTLLDPNLQLERFVQGLKLPTTLTFVNESVMLVGEKDSGKIFQIINGVQDHEPILDANVSYGEGTGMLGLAAHEIENHTYVFVSLIESPTGNDTNAYNVKPEANRLYRYELIHNKLHDPVVLFELPAYSGGAAFHYGGPIAIGGDQLVYYVTGDNGPASPHLSKSINIINGSIPDGTGGILRMTKDGLPAGQGIIGDTYPTSLYFAYGIRNSFGLAFDPLSGNLWDTENGPETSDELNLISKGFNSGWNAVMGKISETNPSGIVFNPLLSADSIVNPSETNLSGPVQFDPILSADKGESSTNVVRLENFSGSGSYGDPKLVWKSPVAPTGITFIDSEELGSSYYGEMVVGNFVNGQIYHFKLNANRTGLELPKDFSDGAIQGADILGVDYPKILLATGFKGITDLELGPDGKLYVISHLDGSIYRIAQK